MQNFTKIVTSRKVSYLRAWEIINEPNYFSRRNNKFFGTTQARELRIGNVTIWIEVQNKNSVAYKYKASGDMLLYLVENLGESWTSISDAKKDVERVYGYLKCSRHEMAVNWLQAITTDVEFTTYNICNLMRGRGFEGDDYDLDTAYWYLLGYHLSR